MNKEILLLFACACSTLAQFFPPGPRPGPFSTSQQSTRPAQPPFFQRQQPQQPGIFRQIAQLFGFDGGQSSDTTRGPAGQRPVPPNQQFFRPDTPPPSGSVNFVDLRGQRNPQQPPIGSEIFVGPQPPFQRPPQVVRQPASFGINQQQSGRIPPGSTQTLSFQLEDVRNSVFGGIATDQSSSSGIPPAIPVSTSQFQQQSAAQTSAPIRPSEQLFSSQPIATQFSNELGGVLPSRGVNPQSSSAASITSSLPQISVQQGNPIQLVSAPSLPQTATLYDILRQDCANFEERGYCESSRRYPTAQITSLVHRCSRILDALYVPVPDTNDISSSSTFHEVKKEINPLQQIERANKAVWSWAKYSAGKGSVCKSETRKVVPNYARDVNKKWVVVLQSEVLNMVQRVPMDMCQNTDQECLSGPEGDKHQGTRCVQRYTHHHLVTWDPDKPEECPSLRAFSFPTACLCHFSSSALRN